MTADRLRELIRKADDACETADRLGAPNRAASFAIIARNYRDRLAEIVVVENRTTTTVPFGTTVVEVQPSKAKR